VDEHEIATQNGEAMPQQSANEVSRVLEIALTSALSVIVTGVIAFILYPHNLPTQKDLTSMQSSIELQLSNIQTQNSGLSAQVASLQSDSTNYRVEIARICDKLQINCPSE
jgi:cell division protein FtsL